MDIRGVGEATADTILDTLNDHDNHNDTAERALAKLRKGRTDLAEHILAEEVEQ